MNHTENNIACAGRGMSIGIIRINVISMSKMMNSNMSRKNRTENGFRGMEFRLMPHSKDEAPSIHFFIEGPRAEGISSMIVIINMAVDQYSIRSIIYLWVIIYI